MTAVLDAAPGAAPAAVLREVCEYERGVEHVVNISSTSPSLAARPAGCSHVARACTKKVVLINCTQRVLHFNLRDGRRGDEKDGGALLLSEARHADMLLRSTGTEGKECVHESQWVVGTSLYTKALRSNALQQRARLVKRVCGRRVHGLTSPHQLYQVLATGEFGEERRNEAHGGTHEGRGEAVGGGGGGGRRDGRSFTRKGARGEGWRGWHDQAAFMCLSRKLVTIATFAADAKRFRMLPMSPWPASWTSRSVERSAPQTSRMRMWRTMLWRAGTKLSLVPCWIRKGGHDVVTCVSGLARRTRSMCWRMSGTPR
mmetsp:Transcript_20900/g.35865  ORF Transcript_20900/g.35865 Transcript_20900/m.35865 type:complete len:315 (+) Transcript_20900:1625-2569(+)